MAPDRKMFAPESQEHKNNQIDGIGKEEIEGAYFTGGGGSKKSNNRSCLLGVGFEFQC